MSSSQHPVALRLQRQVGGATKLLAIVMGLPLIDGIFPALVLAGALDEPVGVLQVGLLVFGGSATLAVILAEMDGRPREQLPSVALVGVVLVVVAGFEAALAPTIESVLDLATFKRFAALVMAAIAAKTASSTIGEYLPRPAVIVGLGIVASFDPTGARFVTVLDVELVAKAAAAAGVGAVFALVVAAFGSTLRGVLDVDRFRFGSAVALGVLPLSVLGVAPGNAPLAVLAVTGLLAFDPAGADPATSSAERDSRRAAEARADGGEESRDPADPRGSAADAAYGYHDGEPAENEPRT